MKAGISKLLTMLASLVLVVVFAVNGFAASAPKMTKETLKPMLDSSDIVVVDVRLGSDWRESDYKIRNAVRVHPGEVESWASRYRKDKTIVFY
jgi:cell division protein YceG involved in septum cleavage